MPHWVPQTGLCSRREPRQMANFTLPLQLEINHTCGHKNGQLGCCLCFPNGTDGSRAPCPGPFQDRKAGHMCWCTCFASRLPVGNAGCYHWQYSHQNLYNFLQIICISTCWNTHPGKRWISLMQSCAHSIFPFVSSNHEAAALQLSRSCFDIKGSMTESHGDQGRKSRAPRPKAEPTLCLCNIHSQKHGKKRDSLETSQTWLQMAQGKKLQGILLDMRVSRDPSQVLPSQVPALPLFQRSNASCA